MGCPSYGMSVLRGFTLSIPDREISVLNSNEISEKSEFFMGGPKISVFSFIKIQAFLKILHLFTFFVFL